MKLFKYYTFTLVLMLMGMAVMAQVPGDAEAKAEKDIKKQYAKADKYIRKNKGDKAVEVLQALTAKYPDYSGPWEKLAKLQYRMYLVASQSDNKYNMKVTVNGGDSANNVLANMLMEMLKPSFRYKTAYLVTCREGTARAWGTYNCAMMLRNANVDNKFIDTGVNEKAREFFVLAEEDFVKKNYYSAAQYYQKAVDADSNFYKAKLYMGDAFYLAGNYPSAIKAFQAAVTEQPLESEPRKYLADALMGSGNSEEAEKVCKEALCLYPDQNMIAKLQAACSQNNKKFYNYWLERPMLPLSAKTKGYDTEKIEQKQSFWKPYYEAYAKIKDYLDTDTGTLRDNTLTKAKYLEVYAWEEMLKNSNADELSYARKMQSKGYLDCYVFITCFHQDFYDQFRHFAANNQQRMADYLDLQTEE